MTDYVKLENIHRVEIVNGKKIVDEKKLEYENPFVKKIKGEKNGKKYSMSIQKRPQNNVTFRVWNPVYKNQRTLTPYYPKSGKCKTMKKKKKKSLYKKE